jgi:hypothetical protein
VSDQTKLRKLPSEIESGAEFLSESAFPKLPEICQRRITSCNLAFGVFKKDASFQTKILNLYMIHKGIRTELTQTLVNLPSPLFVKEG